VFADLRTNVYNFWDRGLLGMALHPDFPNTPRVYVLYTYDAEIGGTAPRWGVLNGTSDPCPNPPGATSDGCVASVRLSILTASGNTSSGEQVLINDWCQQYPSHSAGELRFGADGALYVTAGDAASFVFTDYGQEGSPVNPCGDPSNRQDGEMTAPTAEGGALRAQDVRTAGDPTGLDGALLRLNPDTGAAMAGNPQIGAADANTRRIVAYGLRNAFRFAIRPGTNDIWLGDVGWSDWEEIDRVPDPTASVRNFGWPCVEGASLKPGSYADFDLCSSLYDSGGMTAPYFTYAHGANVAGETCPTDSGSSLSGMTFYTGTAYPSEYQGSLFFADYSRKCIWVMLRGANGLPDADNVQPFINAAAGPVQLKTGPDGDIFYVDLDGGRLHRIVYTGDGPPRAVATATPTSGKAPLTVKFDGTGSSDPDGGPLTFAWDLDDDGAFDDSTAAKPTWTYVDPGTVRARLRVTDTDGLTDRASLMISASGTLTLQLSDLPFLSATNGWGPVERDQSNGENATGDGTTLRINGASYARGLGVHAVSDVRVAIPSGCTTFRAIIGVDDEVGSAGSVRFKVYADAVELFSSPAKRGTDPGQAITLDVTGHSELRLFTGANGDNSLDHADWARARLTCQG
ncbi:MAG TPA: NPCBM/NEW2 domain-containing protein, partial [Candidatus Limnocylindria bacterium]